MMEARLVVIGLVPELALEQVPSLLQVPGAVLVLALVLLVLVVPLVPLVPVQEVAEVESLLDLTRPSRPPLYPCL